MPKMELRRQAATCVIMAISVVFAALPNFVLVSEGVGFFKLDRLLTGERGFKLSGFFPGKQTSICDLVEMCFVTQKS